MRKVGWWSGTAVLVAGASLAACGGTTPQLSPTATTTVVIPSGWKSYAVENVAISVPKDWTVAFNNPGCSTGAPGLLALETSPQEVEICPERSAPNRNTVTLLWKHGTSWASGGTGHPEKVNGLSVYVEFREQSPPNTIEWSVPDLGLQVSGSGPLANNVMHTLRLRPPPGRKNPCPPTSRASSFLGSLANCRDQ